MRSRLWVVPGVLVVGLGSASVWARSSGIGGYSGQAGTTCTSCHREGATKPTVEFVGPSTLSVGATQQYSFILRGGPGVKGGFNLSVGGSADLLSVVDGSVKKLGTELTHTAAKTFDATGSVPELRFDFALTAPATEGSLTLYGAGNSVNGDARSSGDGVAATTFTVTVLASGTDAGTDAGMDAGMDAGSDAGTDAGPGPDAGSDPDAGSFPDAGSGSDAGSGADAGTGPDAGPGPGPGPDAGTVADAGSGTTPTPTPTPEPDPDPVAGGDKLGGCSSTGGAPMLLLGLGAASLLRSRRRRA